MSELSWVADPLRARRPILLAAFRGMFDAGGAATGAIDFLVEHSPSTEKLAVISSEGFVNFQEARPLVTLDGDGDRHIEWPDAVVSRCSTGGWRDLVVLVGEEPNMRWRTFADLVGEVVTRTRAELVITVGAYVTMVPHTRPMPVTGSTASADLATRLNLEAPSYQGPTGVVGVLAEYFDRLGVPNASLRVGVPHYVPSPPSPKATRALLRRIQQLTGLPTGYEELDGDVNDWLARVDEAVHSDDDNLQYVRRLEEQVDSDEGTLPSGDDLAAELEAFLRETGRRPQDDQDPDGAHDTEEPGYDDGDDGSA